MNNCKLFKKIINYLENNFISNIIGCDLFLTPIKKDAILDTRGKPCPIPLIMAKKKIKKMDKGTILEIISDELVSKENLERFGKSKYELLHIKKEADLFLIYIKK